jgi:hypothetical protein
MTSLQYLKWKELVAEVNKENAKQYVLDDVIIRMKKILEEKELKIQIEDFNGYRRDQRFSISDESNHFVREFAEKNNFLLAEGLEVLQYLYCELFLDEKEMEQNGLMNWNIKVEWIN